jgi:signal transduction histidine kinase
VVTLEGSRFFCQLSPPELSALRRVFYNLAHNATDAMPEGGKILLRFQATEMEVITEIEDEGRGIAPEMAGHATR